MDRRRSLKAEFNCAAWSGARRVGRHCVKRLKDVIAHNALEYTQVGAQESRHDASERHLSLALWASGTLDGSERNDGQ
jgi:hypothetical protein